jgi:large subunit ribosomal protein L5
MAQQQPARVARLQAQYKDKIVPELMAKFGFKSVMQVPRLQKITLNMGVSEAVSDKKVMDNAVGDLTKIAGQKPVVTKSKKAIAAFKIRENVPIGCMVTLRGVQMYEFLRWPWQLQHRRQGTDHLPRDRLRQGRRDPWSEHQHHDECEER